MTISVEVPTTADAPAFVKARAEEALKDWMELIDDEFLSFFELPDVNVTVQSGTGNAEVRVVGWASSDA